MNRRFVFLVVWLTLCCSTGSFAQALNVALSVDVLCEVRTEQGGHHEDELYFLTSGKGGGADARRGDAVLAVAPPRSSIFARHHRRQRLSRDGAGRVLSGRGLRGGGDHGVGSLGRPRP